MTGVPAYVRTSRMEIVAANELCRALYGGVLDEDRLPVNLARYLFLDPHSRGFFLDWDHVADDFTGALRAQAGRDPRDKALSDLIGELSTRSDEFVARWARQNVRLHRTARKRLHNRLVGDIELTGDALELLRRRPDADRLHRRPRLTGRGEAAGCSPRGPPPEPRRTPRSRDRPGPTARSPAATDDPPRPCPYRPTTSGERRRETRCTMPDVSTLTLNNGVTLPALGLGVFQTPPDETRDAVTAALEAGYRHIDTAAAYGNERQVGEAIAASGVDRGDVFVETKIWISDYGYDKTLHGFEKSARKLGVDQIDLLILHQALPSDFEATLESYRALETLLSDGKVRAIGVSNFMVDHLTALLEKATVVPAVNQIELHPYFQQREVAGPGRRARHPHPGLVAHRRHHLLPRREAHQHPAGSGDRRHRRGARQDTRSGDAAVGCPAGALRSSRSRPSRPGSRRTWTCSTST